MQEEDEHGCGQEHGRRGALRGRMEGGKGGRWAWRVCYDAMNRMGWRKGGYVVSIFSFYKATKKETDQRVTLQIHLSLIDYICVSGDMERNVLEFVE